MKKKRCDDQTKNDWRKNEPSLCNIAYTNNWIDECCSHMKSKQKKWTEQMCIESASKYQTLIEWRKIESGAEFAARKNRWIKNCTKHMKK
jgi:hypothetical protein